MTRVRGRVAATGVVVWLMAALAAGCKDDDEPATTIDGGGTIDGAASDTVAVDTVANEPLCNGRQEARLTFTDTGGLVPSEFVFTGAYGQGFFVIDGTCRYWAGAEYRKGIRTGTLTAAQGEDIARRLHRNDFPRLKSFGGVACPDGSARILSDGTTKVSCTCDCTTGAPAGFAETFTNLTTVHNELMATGADANLPIRVVATLSEPMSQQPAEIWPLAWSPTEVQVSPFVLKVDSGRLITAPAELTQLRALRAKAAETQPYSIGINVKVTDGTVFVVLPRDEAPAFVVEALKAAVM